MYPRNKNEMLSDIYVRPIIEYAVSPMDNKMLTDSLEMVQRKAARWIKNDWKKLSSPTEMLESLSIKPLKQRRMAAKVKLLYQIKNGTKFVSKILQRQRCITMRFKPVHSSIKCYSNSFFPSTIATWNKLPRDIVNLDDENNFKSKIMDFIF